MVLENINFPQDIRDKSIQDLEILSSEIRDLIIEVVSKKGGHLASSLGAVELSVALHYCMNTPRDRLIFDVGHQTYAHKILTGRKKEFQKLREFNGLSGFPTPLESDYDVYITGHASTAVSYAQGIAEANELLKNQSKAVAVIGDGSLSGGMCFEALNHCGHAQSSVLVIYNHNEMSISPSVGALSNYLTKFVSAPVYNRIKDELEKFLEHFSFIKKLSHKAWKFEEALKSLIVPGIFFEELGFRYFGPIDGHDFNILIPTLKNVLSLKGPRLLHVITKKGKGYKPAEENPEYFHGSVPFDIKTGKELYEIPENFGEVCAKKLVQLAEKDNRITAITAAMIKGTGLNLFGDKFPERLFDVGIAEGHAVGFASGQAKAGLKPYVAIYSTFLQRAYDQIVHDIALQNLGVTFLLDRAGVVGEDGPTHHGVFDIAYLRSIPNMICLAPKDTEELEDMVEFANTLSSPVSIRYPKGSSYSLNKREEIKLGKSQVLIEGKDICIISLGSMVKETISAVKLLNQKSINPTLINARFIKPIDEESIKKIAEQYSLIVTIEEGNLPGGFGSAVCEFLESLDNSKRQSSSESGTKPTDGNLSAKDGDGRQSAFYLNKVKVLRLGLPDKFITFASRSELLSMHHLDAESICETILQHLPQ
ncbi:MAG: hypothetical protein ACD_79C00352G0006 [uncultured bacterium]|nr:MAG: hypothetical protein ACD_79C00352G0006 [uncultured bacterium]